MSEHDELAVEAALESNPMGLAEAEGHLKKGLMMLSEEVGLGLTHSIVLDILARMETSMPARRVH